MLKIEFQSELLEDDYEVERIIINGILDKNSEYERGSVRNESEGEGEGSTRMEREGILSSKDAVREILKFTLAEIEGFFEILICEIDVDWWRDGLRVHFNNRPREKGEKRNIQVVVLIDPVAWLKAWTISDFHQSIKQTIEDLNVNLLSHKRYTEFGFHFGYSLLYEIESRDAPALDVFTFALDKTKEIVEKSTKRLIDNLNQDELTTMFQFPESIKTACKQYLIYFVQFLADLGYDVESELKEVANRTLFKIIPKDGNEALQKIKEALEIYLNAPANPNAQPESISNDIAVLQWQANIYHLKGQLGLSMAVVQAKEATIDALQLSNYQLKDEILNLKSKKAVKDEEPLIKGVVSVKDFDIKGLSIKLPEIVRKLKRRLR